MFSGYMTVNIIYSWRHKRAQEHTIINVMNVHVLYCDLMDFPYMDIFMRNVFYFKKSQSALNPTGRWPHFIVLK